MHEVLNKARSECPIASLGDDPSAMVFPLLICRLMPHSRLSNDQGRLDITAVDRCFDHLKVTAVMAELH